MKTKTPLAEAIEKLTRDINFITDEDSIEDRYCRQGLKRARDILIEMLPKEKAVIKHAYTVGGHDWYVKKFDSEVFLTDNYTQES